MCIPTSARSVLILALAMGAAHLAFREPAQAADIPTATVEEVSQLVASGGAHIFDANSAKQFAAGHVPGAVHLPFDQVTAERLPSDTGAKLVFYCWNKVCGASHEAATRAVNLGYRNVSVMRDGITGWIKAGHPVKKSADRT